MGGRPLLRWAARRIRQPQSRLLHRPSPYRSPACRSSGSSDFAKQHDIPIWGDETHRLGRRYEYNQFAEQLRRACHWELKHNCCNTEGRAGKFNEFVNNQLETRLVHDLVGESNWVSDRMAVYPRLSEAERQQAVVFLCEELTHCAYDGLTEDDFGLERPSTEGLAELSGETQMQRTSEWHSHRSSRLTASSFGAVLGEFGPDAREEVWQEKAGIAEPFKGNARTQWGTEKEANALESFQDMFKCTDVGSVSFTASETDPWLGASPDGLLGEDGLLEIKCPTKNRSGGVGFEDAVPHTKVPSSYYAQMQGQMQMLGRRYCVFFSWTQRKGTNAFLVARSERYWKPARWVLQSFWFDNVLPAKRARALNLDEDDISMFRPPRGGHDLSPFVRRVAGDELAKSSRLRNGDDLQLEVSKLKR